MFVEVLCWIDRVWSSKQCACCAYAPSVHLGVPSIGFLCVFVCQKLSPHLKVGELDHMCLLSLCCFCVGFFYTMWLRKSLQLLCILPFGMLCVYVICMMFVKYW